MKYFITSDVHSYFNELMASLKEKGFEIDNKEHKLVICGDLFDRGDGTVPLFNFIKELCGQDRLIYVRGNHEDLLFECAKEMKRGLTPSMHHFHNGTVKTICEFCGESIWKGNEEWIKKIIKNAEPLLMFIDEASVDYFEIGDYICVHGWLITRNNESYKTTTPSRWKGLRWCNGMSMWSDTQNRIEGKTVICGHWHCSWGHSHIHKVCSEWGQDAIFEPFVDEGIIAIDACTAHSGKVNVMVIEEDK